MEDPHFTSLANAQVAIAGLGLMGGSLALALRGQCRELLGVDTDGAVLEYAREHGVVDRAVAFESVGSADMLVMAAPVRAILALLARLPARAAGAQDQVVLDLGSTKSAVAAAMDDLPAGYDPIGGHPMCGKEVSGLAHADANLFRGRVFVLSPLARTTPRALGLAREVAGALGARLALLPADRHDRLTATSSHLPYAAAAALVRAAESLNDEQLWELAASGFRDTSRLAASDVTMMTDILLTNREAILDALARYQAQLGALVELLRAGEPAALRAYLEQAATRRRGLFQ